MTEPKEGEIKMALDVTFLAAFTAGIMSFLSPCVLPLLPPYLSFLGGVSVFELTTDQHNTGRNLLHRPLLLSSFGFVLGFSAIFVLLGASASLVGQILLQHRDWFQIGAGLFIIAMGCFFAGLIPIPLLQREVRLHLQGTPKNLLGSCLFGMAFGFGWTPCLGPILGSILTIAATTGSLREGIALLAAYAAGLALPFLAAAAFLSPFLKLLRSLNVYIPLIKKGIGFFLILNGIVFLNGWFLRLSAWLSQGLLFGG